MLKLQLTLFLFRVWYALEVIAEAGDPIGVLRITCPVQRAQICEIQIKNPSAQTVKYEVNRGRLRGK